MRYTVYATILLLFLLVVPVAYAANNTEPADNPWYWYNNAVDLANAGKFSEALQANEKALALNQSIPLAWANEAGILVQLGRYDEAIAAADHVLSTNATDLPNTYAAAYYSRGDALRGLGRTDEAIASYARAYQLDPSLVPPVVTPTASPSVTQNPAAATSAVSPTVPVKASPSATRSPLPPVVVAVSLMAALGIWHRCRRS